MSDKELNELGRIAYGAACLATGCKQPWDEANQGKWIAAANAVQTLVRDNDRATNLEIVYHQIKEIKDPIRPFVRCPCLKKLDLLHAYRCLYCGIWFCETCAEQHFGKTKSEHLKEKEAQSDER